MAGRAGVYHHVWLYPCLTFTPTGLLYVSIDPAPPGRQLLCGVIPVESLPEAFRPHAQRGDLQRPHQNGEWHERPHLPPLKSAVAPAVNSMRAFSETLLGYEFLKDECTQQTNWVASLLKTYMGLAVELRPRDAEAQAARGAAAAQAAHDQRQQQQQDIARAAEQQRLQTSIDNVARENATLKESLRVQARINAAHEKRLAEVERHENDPKRKKQ